MPGATAIELHDRLRDLMDELATARRAGLSANGTYMDDLGSEIARCRAAYVLLAVTEMASHRALLCGRLEG